MRRCFAAAPGSRGSPAALVTMAVLACAASADTLSATVSHTPTGPSMPSGFVGVSFEYRAMHQYTGRDPRAIDPVLLSLLQGLAPGQSPVIRIGGNSTDDTWWPIRGMIPQGGIYYRLTKGWLRTTQALAADLNAKLILGINLAAGRSAIAAAEGRAFVSGIGRRYIQALEIGNEPDLYPIFYWYRDRRGHVYRRRSRAYDLASYTKQFSQWARALPNIPLAGPAVSGPGLDAQARHLHQGRAAPGLGHLPPLSAAQLHHQPQRSDLRLDPQSAGRLLVGRSGGAAVAVRQDGRGSPSAAADRRDELRLVSGQGGGLGHLRLALWSLDTMFNFAAQGVQGVNFHMLPGSHYELFTVSQTAQGAWQAFVHPEYYGLMMFAQAFPPGARLLPVTAPAGPVKVWATAAPDGTVRIVGINQDGTAEHDVQVLLPGSTTRGSLQTLTAPSLAATTGVSLGGQSFGDETTTGTLPGAPAATPVTPSSGVYTIALAAGSAGLVTIPGAAAAAARGWPATDG